MGLIKATGEWLREVFDTHGRIAAMGAIVISLVGVRSWPP